MRPILTRLQDVRRPRYGIAPFQPSIFPPSSGVYVTVQTSLGLAIVSTRMGMRYGMRQRWTGLAAAVPAASGLIAPILSNPTSTPSWDTLIGSDTYVSYTRHLRVFNDSGLTVQVQHLVKPIVMDELATGSSSWLVTADPPPRDATTGVITGLNMGTGHVWWYEYIERDDGVVSPNSNVLDVVIANPVLLSSATADKSSNITLSNGSLTGATAGFDGSAQMVRSNQAKGGKRQFGAKITSAPQSGKAFVLGIEDGATTFGPSSTIPGAANNAGIVIEGGNWGYVIAKNGANVQSGATTFGLNDVIECEYDTTAGTVSFFKNGTQVGTTITGLGTIGSTAYACFGVDGNGCTFDTNFTGVATAFTHALSSGYSAFDP